MPIINGSRSVAVVDDCFLDRPDVLPDCPKIFIHASEKEKTLETVERIVSELLELQADRDTFIIGIGGGITTDITAFVASVYKRGVRYGLIPTTLLSQLDASIGGKNGVNFSGFKNIIGTFGEPDWIYVNPSFLETLGRRQFLCGVAEMLKTFLIADEKFYHSAVELFLDPSVQPSQLLPFIRRAVQIKCSIVRQDPFDRGIRHLLNFGHTYAHAIEKCDSSVLHGEAVAIGMVMASRTAVERGFLDEGEFESIVSDFSAIGLPTEAGICRDDLEQAVLQDKKRSGSVIRMVLLKKIGEAFVWEKSVTA